MLLIVVCLPTLECKVHVSQDFLVIDVSLKQTLDKVVGIWWIFAELIY